ncbi:MAG TPA: hypothetical protein P5556_08265 [Candidatus Gastranaerophilales bacterium]|nr:hypothetical protein [Candidatus Gastranaerophilales bacterium]
MALSYFMRYSTKFIPDLKSRNNPIDVWKDFLTYSSNLNGNWLYSKQIFYSYILPTAEKNPVQFAKWIKKMVKKSGIKIKSKSEFIEAIKYLSGIKGKNERQDIKKALYSLLNSGLEEPTYALNALTKHCA